MNKLRDDNGPSAPVPDMQGGGPSAFVTLELSAHDTAPGGAVQAHLGDTPCAHLFLFASPNADLLGLIRDLERRFPQTQISGCTTAGEIGGHGYTEDKVIVVALPAAHFASTTVLLPSLSTLTSTAVAEDIIGARLALSEAHPDKPEGFAFLMVDGLCLREDVLVGALSPALGRVPLFGGSAGDGTNFRQTLVAVDGAVHTDAAVVTLIQTDHRVQVFSLDHLQPTGERMVVTAADPDQRIVKEINAEPAGREYARIIGKDPDQLDELTFAAHPVCVRLGDTHHVRAIQRVNSAGELVFFSAIDEGMVLSVAESDDMVSHLDTALQKVTDDGKHAGILACDCILRRVAAEQGQYGRDVSEILARYGITGFSTYGEQIGPLHLNQTMTGVVLFPPAAITV